MRRKQARLGAMPWRRFLSGKLVERAERGSAGEFAILDNMSAVELEAYAKGELVLPETEGKLN